MKQCHIYLVICNVFSILYSLHINKVCKSHDNYYMHVMNIVFWRLYKS